VLPMGVWYIGILVVVYGDGRRLGAIQPLGAVAHPRGRLSCSGRAGARAGGRGRRRARARACACTRAVVVVLFNTVRYTAKRLV